MAIKKSIYLTAFAITLFLFITIILFNITFNQTREEKIATLVQESYNNFNEVQTFLLMSEIYGDNMSCIVFRTKLQDLDKSLWDLGLKIDQYRLATEQFQKDPFYIEKKREFNENEVFYLMLLTKIKQRCNYATPTIVYFYRNAQACPQCDAQSFILTDIKQDNDRTMAVFSLDADINSTTIRSLVQYYNITIYPCLIINEQKYCGLRNKQDILTSISR